MRIELQKFGTTLVSRQAGKEAFSAFLPTLNEAKKNEKVEVSFEGIHTFSPSWGDEFLRPLQQKFDKQLFLLPSNNPSVSVTLELLEETNKMKFNIS